MTDFLYRFAYRIEDQDLTTQQVRDEALAKFPVDAARRGVRITGPVQVAIDGDRVVCEADAETLPGRQVTAATRYGLTIADLAERGFGDAEIGHALGVSSTTVGNTRKELGIPSGRSRRKQAA